MNKILARQAKSKVALLASILLSLSAGIANAGNDWLKAQQAEFNQYSQQTKSDFKAYLDKNDAEFLRWMKQDWKQYKRFNQRVRDAQPKPKKPPVKEGAPKVLVNNLKPSVKPTKPVTPKPRFTRPQPPQTETAKNFEFYGLKLSLPVPVGMQSLVINRVNKQVLADAFESLAKVREKPLLTAFNKLSRRYQLSDWAKVQLVKHYASLLYKAGNSRYILSWYLLNKLGYQAQLGIVNRNVVVLISTQQMMYERPYFMVRGRAYYPISGKVNGKLQTYDGQYNVNNRPLDLRFNKTILTAKAEKRRHIKWKNKSKKYDVNISFNPNRVEYFKRYPQIDLGFYFDAPVSAQTAQSLKQQLRPMLLNKTPQQQVNLLLSMVQYGFNYAVDDEQFGRENYLLPEETLYYPSSDCEDRAFIFAWLVKELLGMDVIGISYPGHVATAVALSGGKGSQINYHGRRYTVADPTYIGSKIGQAMPQFRNTAAKIVPVL